MDEIKTEDRAYFAGLLDGEGSISITKGIHKNGGSISYAFKVGFGLTYKTVLLEMQKLFGGNIYTRDMEKTKNSNSVKRLVKVGGALPEGWKQQYYYTINGRDALYFLKVVEPFCREKKEQAALGIRYEQGRRPRAGNYGRSDSETKRCEFFYRELQRLKHEELIGEDENDFEDEQQNLFSFEVEP